jgi:signal transduction histidine kinase
MIPLQSHCICRTHRQVFHALIFVAPGKPRIFEELKGVSGKLRSERKSAGLRSIPAPSQAPWPTIEDALVHTIHELRSGVVAIGAVLHMAKPRVGCADPTILVRELDLIASTVSKLDGLLVRSRLLLKPRHQRRITVDLREVVERAIAVTASLATARGVAVDAALGRRTPISKAAERSDVPPERSDVPPERSDVPRSEATFRGKNIEAKAQRKTTIDTDPDQLEALLVELIRHAIETSPAVTVRVRPGRDAVAVELAGAAIGADGHDLALTIARAIAARLAVTLRLRSRRSGGNVVVLGFSRARS